MNQATTTDLALEEAQSINESFQADVASLSNQIADCVRSTDCFLTDPINRGKVGRFRISRITLGLLGLNAALTLILNISMVNAGATIVQLLICNSGLMIFHLLASICIASDLARGKTHFLNERTHLARQFHELSDHMNDLLQERQKWLDALNRCKWSMDTERLKVQLVAQELKSIEEKLLAGKSLLTEKQKEVTDLDARYAATLVELQKTSKEQDIALTERNKLRTEAEHLQNHSEELGTKIKLTEDALASKEAELKTAQEDLQAFGNQRSELENQLTNVDLELKSANAILAAQQSQQVESLANFESKIARLNLDQATIEASIQSATLSHAELEETIKQSQIQLATMRSDREKEIASLEKAIDDAKAVLNTKQTEIDATQTVLHALAATQSTLESELAQAKEGLQDLKVKAEHAQLCNVQLVNESISLERKGNQQRESLARIEADLQNAQDQLLEKSAALDSMRAGELELEKRLEELNALEIKDTQHRETVLAVESELQGIQREIDAKASTLDAMRAEELKLEMRVANLLTQAGTLDCLSVATNESNQYSQELKHAEQIRLIEKLTDQKNSLEASLKTLHSQIESERLGASHMKLDAEKSVSDAEHRVQMLTDKAESLTRQVQDRSEELYTLKQQLVDLRSELRDLEAANLELNEVEYELQGLKAHLADQRSQIATANAQIAECDATHQTRLLAADKIEQQITNLESQLQIAIEQHQARLQKIEHLTAEQDAILAQNQFLTQQNDDLQFTIRESFVAKEETTIRLSELHTQAENQREQILQLEAERTAIESDVVDLKAKLHCLRTQNDQFEGENERLRELVEQRSMLEEEVANLVANIETFSQQQDTAVEFAALHEQSLKDAELQLRAMRDELAALEQKYADTMTLQEQAAHELARSVQMQQTVADQYETALQQTQSLQQLIRELQAQTDSVQAQRKSASANLQQVIDEVSDAQSVAKQWTTYIDTLKEEVDTHRKLLDELQRSIESLREGESQAMIDMERATNEVESLIVKQAALRAGNQAEELALRTTQIAIDEANHLRIDLQHDLQDMHRRLTDLSKQAEDTKCELLTAEADVNAALASKATLENQIIDRQTMLETLASDHDSRLNRVRELAEEQQFLEKSLGEMNKQISASESVIASLESRKHQLEQEVQQQRSLQDIAIERRTAVECEIAMLTNQIAELQVAKLELEKVESECSAKTATLNSLCEESALEQARLNDIKEQTVAAESLLNELHGQRENAQRLREELMQEIQATQIRLTKAKEAIQEQIDSKAAVTEQLSDLNRELKELTDHKMSSEAQLRELSEQLSAKEFELQATEERVTFAESKALELWSTISELQNLGTDLERTLNNKRDAVSQATAEMVKFDEIRMALLAQRESLETDLASFTLQLTECQASKRSFDHEISNLTAEVDRLNTEIVKANEELDLLEERIAAASAIELEAVCSVAPESQDEQVSPETAIAELSVLSLETDETIEAAPTDTLVAKHQSEEEDIWTSLGELARLGDSVRIDAGSLKNIDEPPQAIPSKHLDIASATPNSFSDEWETVFTPAQR